MQSASLFLFWVLIIIIVFRETYDAFIVNESFAFLFVGISFLVEYSVVGKGIVGLGGEAYNLLGTWLLQSGFSLYTDTFAFKGCQKISLSTASDFIDSKCNLEEDGLRGVALINLLFVAHAIVVFIGSSVLFGLLSSHKNLRHGEASGPLLAQLEPDSSLMRPVPEFELE
ncbi:hypothetical protein Patl1_25674 [Pistacia atlantica]|uniref:Uncharacterized protein n=1 Tax=Pistacia atlantica TaxID=434234 RepID=A0ACC1B206_9ROSI|nr:hypothetical protein Patl1_25674 [Pistacia atlantica]